MTATLVPVRIVLIVRASRLVSLMAAVYGRVTGRQVETRNVLEITVPRRSPGPLLTYRPAVDGLRALAVLSVMAYHMLPDVLPGGWYGVDTFFVISGFLITSLLLAEYRVRHGHIDLLGFWLARCRRLLPALFAVLLLVLLLAPFLTDSGRVSNVGIDVVATIFYVANWRFVLGDEAYFGDIGAPSPVLHTWSLGVEEQFYILFPLLLIGLLAIIRRRATLAGVLGLLTLGSAVLMMVLHHPGLEPSRVYYGTDTRAHQLLAGAAVAVLLSPGPGALPRHVVRGIDRWCRRLSPVALLVLLTAYWWAGDARSALLEGWLLPLSGAVLIVIVATTSPSRSPVQALLSWEPLRRIGVVSYGLYLWHWPIVVFLNDELLGLPTPALVALQAVLTGLLAAVSYRWLERPVRRHGLRALVPKLPRLGPTVAVTGVPLVLAGALTLGVAGTTVSNALPSGPGVHVAEKDYEPGSRITQAAFIGNSVPEGLIDYFDQDSYPDLRLTDITNSGCTTLAAPGYVAGEEKPEQDGCTQWRESWPKRIRRADPDLVVYFVGQNTVTDRLVDGEVVRFGTPEWTRYVRDSLDDVHRMSGDRAMAVVNLSCHAMPTFGKEDLERINDRNYVEEVNDTVASWAEDNDVDVIDQYSLLCPEGRFKDSINGVPLYQDSLHFSEESGDIFWRWLAPRLQHAAGEPRSGAGGGRS